MRGRTAWIAGTVLAYTIPATLVWALLGSLLASIGGTIAVVGLAAIYCAIFGFSEALALRLRGPTLTWQVPASWVIGRTPAAKTVVWGSLLGPGLVTRNPYAGMWSIPFLLAMLGTPLSGFIVGGVVGFTHGIFRALGIAYNATRLRADVHRALFAFFGWRLMDGIVLVALAAYLGVALIR